MDWLTSQFHRAVASHSLPIDTGLPGRAHASQASIVLSEIRDLSIHKDPILQAGVKSGLSVPIVYDGKVHSIINFFSKEERSMSPQEIEDFTKYCTGLVGSGFFSSEVRTHYNQSKCYCSHFSQHAKFDNIGGISGDKIRQVYENIVKEEVFNSKHIYQEVDCATRQL